MFGVEGRGHVVQRAKLNSQHAVGARIAQQGAAGFSGARNALVGQLGKRPFHRRLANFALFRQTDAICRQYRRER